MKELELTPGNATPTVQLNSMFASLELNWASSYSSDS
jgi:hypothetical protein